MSRTVAIFLASEKAAENRFRGSDDAPRGLYLHLASGGYEVASVHQKADCVNSRAILDFSLS